MVENKNNIENMPDQPESSGRGMLEIKNLTKIYRSKSGNSVKALNDVSIAFPETGMVFILGKSGSGKSTLLNVIGGLDSCDDGEFIIKGKSSKKFVGSDFDAYRNTFIGFIFQEYNVLDDFTVGANIGLALELQGKKATSAEINKILSEVDMLDYAKRKPNELSGGQKQRVAIARALVKDPEIIMADEPTGALDSNTGKQIFDTLKELSKTKLVIVVSHDRDFAERYGDRVIEMKDGEILSDITKHEVAAESISQGIIKMGNNLLRIEEGYQLTTRDLELINEYLRSQKGEILVSGDRRINNGVRSSAGITEDNSSNIFDDTDESRDVSRKEYDSKSSKFIRSRLPMKNALKIGSSGLGHKKFRLVSTIALSLVAFTLFGFADTLGAYDKHTAAVESIMDSNIQNASFSLKVKHMYEYPDPDDNYSYYHSAAMNEDDIKYLSEKTGIEFVPVFTGSEDPEWGRMSLTSNMMDTDLISSNSAYTGALYGLTAIDESKINKLGFTLSGRMPQNEEEIAITEFLYRELNLTGFKNREYNEEVDAGSLTLEEGDRNSIIGKHIILNLNGMETTLKITGVIDTEFDYGRYSNYVPTENSTNSQGSNKDDDGNAIVDMIMMNELSNTLSYGFHALGYVSQSNIDRLAEYMGKYGMGSSIGTSMNWSTYIIKPPTNDYPNEEMRFIYRVAKSSDMASVGKINWFDGRTNGVLGENEVLINANVMNGMYMVRYEIGDKIHNELTNMYADIGLQLGAFTDNSTFFAIEAGEAVKLISNGTIDIAEYRDSILHNYNQYAPNPSINPTDDELRAYWAEAICYYQPGILIPAVDDVYVKSACASILSNVYGVDVPADLDRDFYFNVLSYPIYAEYTVTVDDMARFLVQKYAYELCAADDSVFKTEEFYNACMSKIYDSLERWIENYSHLDAVNRYLDSLVMADKTQKAYGDKTYDDFIKEATAIINKLTGGTKNFYDGMYLKVTTWDYNNGGSEIEKIYDQFKIVGTFEGGSEDLMISDGFYALYEAYVQEQGFAKETVAEHSPGVYAFVIAPMPTDKSVIEKLVALTYEEDPDLKFVLQNQVMDTLYNFNEFIEVGAKVFLYVGIGFAVFAALMMMNFISTSISYKRREIGILRAVGARSSDVFKIFFSEAAIIALITYVLSIASTITATIVVNTILRNEGINVTIINFGIRQIILMLLVNVAVAALASFLPVWNIARRNPIDAIKNK